MNFNSKFLRVSAKLPQHHSTIWNGLNIVIEWPKNSVRTGVDEQGKKWHRTQLADYGYIPQTTGAGDKECLDVYIGPDTESDKAYVVEQLKDNGKFDEYKVLLGFLDLDTAYETYLKHYPDGWDDKNVGEVSEVPFEDVVSGVKEHQEEKTAARILWPHLKVVWPDPKIFLVYNETSERKVLPFSSIVPSETPWKPRVEELVEKIQKSHRVTALVVAPRKNELYNLIDGHHRLEALKKLGYTEVPCLILYGGWDDRWDDTRVGSTFKIPFEDVINGVQEHQEKTAAEAWHDNIEQLTIDNENYREVLFTGKREQLVLMSLLPNETVGNEVHPDTDQFFRIEQGKAEFQIDNGKQTISATDGDAVVVPAGTWHNVINTSNEASLKFYTVYSPPEHPADDVEPTKKASKITKGGWEEKTAGRFSTRQFPTPYKGYEILYRNGVFLVLHQGWTRPVSEALAKFGIKRKAYEYIDSLPEAKIHSNDAKTSGFAYLKALQSMTLNS